MIVSGIGALLLVVVLAAVGLRWLLDSNNNPSGSNKEPDIDYDELAKAEREVRELDADVEPDEADEHLEDWGPGAPR